MKRWGAFALLCVAQGISWIPLQHSGAGITAASCAAGACIAAVVLMWITDSTPMNVLGFVCLVVGPWLELLLGSRMPGSGAVVLALTLVPVVVAVAGPAMGDGEFSPARLWPGLAAATALMIIAPLPSFADWRTDLVLLLTPVVVGVGCVLAKLHTGWLKDRALSLGISAGIFMGMAAATAIAGHQHISVSLIAVAVSAVTFTLLALAIRTLSARQYASQYAIVPLFVLLQGPVVVSVDVLSWRFAVCAVLLLAAGVALLRDDSSDSEEKLA
jgi:hypothetical protein